MAKSYVPLRKENEQIKVLEELVQTYLTNGWKKVVVVKGKRDAKGNLLDGQEDKVELVGLEDNEAALKKANKELTIENDKLKAELAALKK